jgi:hypothetical protein
VLARRDRADRGARFLRRRPGRCRPDHGGCQCFDADLDKKTLLVAKIADCGAPHAGEAYATASAALAGLAGKEKDLSAAEGCANSFEDFVGKAYDTSELEIFFVVLQDDEVAEGNVLCMLGKPGKQLTGSMRGSRR